MSLERVATGVFMFRGLRLLWVCHILGVTLKDGLAVAMPVWACGYFQSKPMNLSGNLR